MKHSPILAVAGLIAADLASAQSSIHRADFTTAQNVPLLASFTISDQHDLSIFIDAGSEVHVSTARVEHGGELVDFPLVGGSPVHGEVEISSAMVNAVRAGAAVVALGTTHGTIAAPIVDPGTASYGVGGATSGLAPKLDGLGHAVADGTIAIVANGLAPGRLGAFVFSAQTGAGEWSNGVPMLVGPIAAVELRVPDNSRRVEWRMVLPPGAPEGASFYVQYVELNGSTPSAATNGVRVQVRRQAPFFIEHQDNRIVTRFASGYQVTSVNLGPDGLADMDTHTFFDQTPENGGTTTLSPAVMAHPALNVATSPLQGHVEPGSTGLDLAVEEELAWIGGIGEVTGTWALGWVTDGCSSIPVETKFEDCCNLHDMLYSIGGSEADRLAADVRLADCVLARTGNFFSVREVYNAVRNHGRSHFNFHGPPGTN